MNKTVIILTVFVTSYSILCFGQNQKPVTQYTIGDREVTAEEMKGITTKARVPKIIMEYPDDVTGKYPSEMTSEERADYDKRMKLQQAERMKNVEQTRGKGDAQQERPKPVAAKREFKTETAEIIKVSKKDKDKKILTVKLEDGKTIELNVPSYVRVTKTYDVSELPRGEKVQIRYMESDEANRLMHISTNIRKIPRMPQIPVKKK